jgi:hypothetical protein
MMPKVMTKFPQGPKFARGDISYWENAVFQRVSYRKKTKDRSKHFQRSDSVRRQAVRVSSRDGQQSGRCSEGPMRSTSTYKIFTPFNWNVLHPAR